MVGFSSTFSRPISPFMARTHQHLSHCEEHLKDKEMATSGRTRSQFVSRRKSVSRNCTGNRSPGFFDAWFELPDASIVGLSSDLDSDPDSDIESDLFESKLNTKITFNKYGSKLRGNCFQGASIGPCYFNAREKNNTWKSLLQSKVVVSVMVGFIT